MDLLQVFLWEESEVFERVAKAIDAKPTATDGTNYAFWNRKSPIIIQAHIDVVLEGHSKWKWSKELNDLVPVVKELPQREILRCRNVITSNVGILGGDDRAGVAAIISINNTCKAKGIPLPSILLTNGEESGGTGMKVFINLFSEELFGPVRIIIGMDRKGCNEYVTYVDQVDEVTDYVESFGFIKGYGSYSDSKDFSKKFNIPHVNLSIGYYNGHSTKETVHIDEMLLTAKRVLAMIKDPIEKRYENKKEKIYVPYKPPVSYINPRWNEANDKRFDKLDKMRKRCERLREKHKFPSICVDYPYLDFMLTNSDLSNNFHIVSTVSSNGKTLEEWNYLFTSAFPDDICDLWRKHYGDKPKVYIKVDKGNKFYLAVQIKQNDFKTPRSTSIIDFAEEKILADRKKKLEEIAKIMDKEEIAERNAIIDADSAESNVAEIVPNDVTLDNFAQAHGYCRKWSEGECSGECHGNIHYCSDPEIQAYSGSLSYFM